MIGVQLFGEGQTSSRALRRSSVIDGGLSGTYGLPWEMDAASRYRSTASCRTRTGRYYYGTFEDNGYLVVNLNLERKWDVLLAAWSGRRSEGPS